MRVVIVLPSGSSIGGTARALLTYLGTRTARTDVAGIAFLQRGDLVDEVRRLGFEVTVLPFRRVRHPQTLLLSALRLAKLTRRVRADAVLSWEAKGAYVSSLARLTQPELTHVVYHQGWGLTGADRFAFKLPLDRVLSCSTFAGNQIRAIYPKLPVTTVHPPAPDVPLVGTHILRRAKRASLGLEEDDLVVGTVARLDPWKGVHLLMNCAETLLEDDRIHLVVVGGVDNGMHADYGEALLKRSRSYGGRVHMAGQQPNGSSWIPAFDVFVHTSSNEPFGLVLLEAAQLGVPIVASNTGGPVEILQHERSALLVDPSTTSDLVAAIRSCLYDEASTQERVDAARAVPKRFSAERFAHVLRAELRLVSSGS